MTSATMLRYKFLGTTDEITACECCGKMDLKLTVGIEDLDTGEQRHFGTTCAARALKLHVAEVKRGAKAADDARYQREVEARRLIAEAEAARWSSYLIEQTGGIYYRANCGNVPDIGAMIERLGGFKAARADYRARTSA